ncbi:hypothetical protein BJ944DRAFT_250080 [Cunninghamella echinulata]|nr:hypothetical protein BJ944DRAFT_250080 [Cunninghamella echinulata]
MTSSSVERVFVIGGTGNVGKKAVEDLLANKVPVTLYTRNPSKVTNLFPKSVHGDLVSIVEGDLVDLTPLKEGLNGHTRLFLLVTLASGLPSTKGAIAKLAYEAGIQQIVDISSTTVSLPWRTNFIGDEHYLAEKSIYDSAVEYKRSFVALRPGRFMSNVIYFDRPTDKGVFDVVDPSLKQAWISPNDIGAVAAVILQDDIKKHGNAAYELDGDVITPIERTEILSRVLGRPLTYHRVSSVDKYNQLKQIPGFPFGAVFGLAAYVEKEGYVTPGIAILLGREPETFEQYITANKDALL